MPRAVDRCHATRSQCTRAARLPPCWPRWVPPGAEIPRVSRIYDTASASTALHQILAPDLLRPRALADEACGRRNISPSFQGFFETESHQLLLADARPEAAALLAEVGGTRSRDPPRLANFAPRPEAHQAAPDGMAADKLQTLAKRMKKSSDARGASPWCRPNISNPARSQAKPRATLSCRSRHLHPLTGERQRGMPRGSLRERPNVLARDAREHVFASFSYDNGPADSAGVVRHGRPSTRRRRVIPSLAVRSRRRRRGRPLARRHARAAAPVSPAAMFAAPAPPRLASPLLSL